LAHRACNGNPPGSLHSPFGQWRCSFGFFYARKLTTQTLQAHFVPPSGNGIVALGFFTLTGSQHRASGVTSFPLQAIGLQRWVSFRWQGSQRSFPLRAIMLMNESTEGDESEGRMPTNGVAALGFFFGSWACNRNPLGHFVPTSGIILNMVLCATSATLIGHHQFSR
jgi:hypothetical protein